jgi:hypothetical protein
LREIAATVRDDAEHVEHVGEAIGVLDDLFQQVLGFVELALLVVLAPEQEQLLQVVIHAYRAHEGRTCDTPRRPSLGR